MSYVLVGFSGVTGNKTDPWSVLEIRRSLGIARGKDDKADAKRIALYGYRIREEIAPYQMPSKSLAILKRLMSLRRKLVVHRAGYLANLKEQKRVLKENF